MALSVFAAPILADKVEAWRRFSQEMLESRCSEHEESRRRLGISKEFVFLQYLLQGPLAIICIEAVQPERVVQQMAVSDLPFDRWFREQLREVYGIDITYLPPGAPSELTFAWQASLEYTTERF